MLGSHSLIMLPSSEPDTMGTSRPTSLDYWTSSLGTQPTNVFQGAWPGFLVAVPAQVPASRPTLMALDSAAIMGPQSVTPLFYSPIFDNQTASKSPKHCPNCNGTLSTHWLFILLFLPGYGSSSNCGLVSTESRKFYLHR